MSTRGIKLGVKSAKMNVTGRAWESNSRTSTDIPYKLGGIGYIIKKINLSLQMLHLLY